MSGTHKVRVKQNPTVEVEVDESEYTDLLRQGLLVTAGEAKKIQSKHDTKEG